MKPPLLVVAVALTTAASFGGLPAAAEPTATTTPPPVEGLMCVLGTTALGYVPVLDQVAPAGASKDVKKLMTALCPKGCGQVGVFKNPTSPSAMALTVGSHASKIAYRASFLESAERSYGPRAAPGIFAHEIGHHVEANAPPAAWMLPQWGTELRADARAACALARLGGKAGDVKGAMQALATYPSASHPSWTERAAALQTGYRSCGGAKLAELEPRSAGTGGGAARGCAEDRECKIGRVCFDGRCQEAALRRTCAKDVDCPGQQICAGAGVCQIPAAPGSAPGSAPAASDRMASSPPAECHDRCGDDQETCSGRTDRTLRECKAALIADRRYKDCNCPRWPAGRLDCYQFCKDTFDKAKACEATHELDGTMCLSPAARCVSDFN